MTLPTQFRPKFSCTGCGKCCTGNASYVVEVSPREQRVIQRHLSISRAWFRRKYLFRFDEETESLVMPHGRCIFLDGENRCRIYKVRPLQCRTYPWWPELMNVRAWRLEARRCEGVGRGNVVPLAEIRAALRRQGR